MVNILLVCSAGMSTSMLVKKMQDAAEQKEIEATIWATGDANAANEAKKADIMLLGPQVRFLQNKMKGVVGNAIPVEVIDMQAYGAMNGAKVLDNALNALENFHK
ncbi:MAG: PTS sugar transporter subunit IIB [Erysipelotrichia bacterium]|nr:PTS sugar transporter subunit IIB [Erysipelotrichia bacterium]NCC55416.1 PTS sugar transporter subunit IIB [Erysipelotrichia bacterium]